MHINTAPDHVVVLSLKGLLTREDIKSYKTTIASKLDKHSHVGLVVDISQWSDITPDAIEEDIKLEMSLINELKRFPKIAIISDKQFVHGIKQLASGFLPMAEVHIFGSDQMHQAIAFASELPEHAIKERDAIVPIQTNNPKVIAYEIHGTVSKDGIQDIISQLEEAFKQEGKIDLLVHIQDYKGFDPSILTMQSLISVKTASLNHVRRYAIVGGSRSIESMVKLFNPFVSIDMRTFKPEEEAQAWVWLESK